MSVDYVTDDTPVFFECGVQFDDYEGHFSITYSGTHVNVLASLEGRDPSTHLTYGEEIDMQFDHWPLLAEIISEIYWKLEP